MGAAAVPADASDADEGPAHDAGRKGAPQLPCAPGVPTAHGGNNSAAVAGPCSSSLMAAGA